MLSRPGICAAAVVSFFICAGPSYSGPVTSFTTLNYPGALETFATGINDTGQVSGWSTPNLVSETGFLYSGGTFTPIGPPGIITFGAGLGPRAMGINDSGQIVGFYPPPTMAGGTQPKHGFLYSGGTYTTIVYPLATGDTEALGINATGGIVGTYVTGGISHGFLYSGGTYTTLDDPLGIDSVPSGINDAGQIVGTYRAGTTLSDPLRGFLYSGGSFSDIEVPNSDSTNGEGINDAGQIVGYYSASSVDFGNGFLYYNGVYTTFRVAPTGYPLGTVTYPFGINDAGQIAGVYNDGQLHGFVLDISDIPTTVPEPVTVALLGIGIAGLGFSRRKQ